MNADRKLMRTAEGAEMWEVNGRVHLLTKGDTLTFYAGAQVRRLDNGVETVEVDDRLADTRPEKIDPKYGEELTFDGQHQDPDG